MMTTKKKQNKVVKAWAIVDGSVLCYAWGRALGAWPFAIFPSRSVARNYVARNYMRKSQEVKEVKIVPVKITLQ